MKKSPLLISLSLVCLIIFTTSAQPYSDFALNDEGWTALCELPCVTTPGPQGWININGNTLGCFKVTDNANGVWYYNSPAEFNIDLTAYYGGTLTFDLKQNGTAATQYNDCDVMIVKSDGTRIVYDTPSNPIPANSWISYSVMLSEAGWKYTNLLGSAVTTVDFMSFISTFSVIKIRGDFSTSNSETTWFDNAKVTLPVMLPIGLKSFTGNLIDNNTAQLNWETASEINADYFEIEKSLDYGISFDPIGKVKAIGNSIDISDYVFIDDNFKPDSYYRLKLVDVDAHIKYSNIILIQGNTPANTFTVQPNPVSDILQFQIFNSDLYQSIVITDSYGRVALRQSLQKTSENFSIDVHSFTNGIYFLTLIGNTEVKSTRFQILH